MKETNKYEEIIKIDALRRILISYEKRQQLGMGEKERVEIYRSGKNIIIEKFNYKAETKNIYQEQKVIDQETTMNIEITITKCNIKDKIKKGHFVRLINELGQVVIPIEIILELGIKEDDRFKECIKDNKIILIKKEKDRRNGKDKHFKNNKSKRKNCHR